MRARSGANARGYARRMRGECAARGLGQWNTDEVGRSRAGARASEGRRVRPTRSARCAARVGESAPLSALVAGLRVAGDALRTQRARGEAMVAKDAETRSAAAMPLFTLAAATMVDRKMIGLVTQSVASFIKLYLLLLFVRVLLTWFPNVNWMRQPWTMLRQVTDPYLNLFRNLIPPVMGQIDFVRARARGVAIAIESCFSGAGRTDTRAADADAHPRFHGASILSARPLRRQRIGSLLIHRRTRARSRVIIFSSNLPRSPTSRG